MPGKLADRLARRDADRFVGRHAELARLDRLLAGDDDEASVVFVHGPGGIGKSTLLRELARRAAVHRRPVLRLDGRDAASAATDLEALVRAAVVEERPLLLLDTYERLSALDTELRERWLPRLPEQALVVVASRSAPAPEWSADGWEHVTSVLALPPLTEHEGLALLDAAGGIDPATARALVAASAGSPLALALAAEVARRDGGWTGGGLTDHPQVVEGLVRRLIGDGTDGPYGDVAAIAAIAAVTTPALLAATLPGRDAGDGYRWLCEQSVVEPTGDGVAPHDLVRSALRAHLRRTRPDREGELRRRVADALLERAIAGEPRLIAELAAQVQNPATRWGFGTEGAAELHAAALEPGDLDDLPAHVVARGSAEWWRSTRALLATSPEHFVAARDARGALCGLAIAFTPSNASPAALADPLVRGWIHHAATHAPDGSAMVWRDSLDLTPPERGDLGSRVLAVVNTAAVLRSGLGNPRCFYLPINPVNAASVAYARESGSVHLDALDVTVSGLRHECHLIDFGPDGLLGTLRDTVYAETGSPPPNSRLHLRGAVTAADVRQALRDLDRPSALAASPLAAVVDGDDPAVAVRALLVAAAADAFGDGADETLLRDLVDRAYVDHRTSHEQAADDLHVSRTTYFRRLRQATGRVADYVVATVAAQREAA